jgi:hypothetical protein
MKRIVSVLLVAVVLLQAAVFAVDSRKALYVGGTIAGLSENVEGRINTTDEDAVTFIPDSNSRMVSIPYKSITGLEYGQKAGRRVGAAILVSPLMLFSKKRKHYLTIEYKDGGKAQAGVFEIGKDIVRTTLKVLETRSGQEVEYQDDEARKSGKG